MAGDGTGARDEILRRLRARSREQAPPAEWRSRREYADLPAQFAEALTASKGKVYREASLADAVERLGTLLEEIDARRIVVNDEPPFDRLELPARWPNREWHVVGRSNGEARAFCAGADAGLSSASAALAETGTIVIESGPGRSRLATLLPPVHIALVPTSCLTVDVHSWVRSLDREPPAALTFVSGPSKTADIEQTLAVGIHGPKQFIVVLYEEAG